MNKEELLDAKKIDGRCIFCELSDSNCPHYISNPRTGFREIVMEQGKSFLYDDIQHYMVFFTQFGEILLTLDDGRERTLPEHSMILFSRGDVIRITAQQKTTAALFEFALLPQFCEKVKLQTFHQYCDFEYGYRPTMMYPNLQVFLSECIYLVRNGMHCSKYSELKQTEFFYLLGLHYSAKEIALFLHPVIGRSMDFKDVIMRSYTLSITAVDLMKHTGYGHSTFYTKFKKEFGMPVKEWIVKQRVGQIRMIGMEPDMTVKEMMYRCGFISSSHFSDFCKRNIGMTPTDLINSLKAERK